jgi:aryl-alcohol dehydrogenase-like predicted oxidoreductase
MDKFVEAGGNFIDTANIYGKGESERVGTCIKTLFGVSFAR